MQRRSRRRRSRGHEPNYQRLRKRTTQQLVMTTVVLAGLIIFSSELATETAGCFGTMGQASDPSSTSESGYDAAPTPEAGKEDPQPPVRLEINRVKSE